MKRENVIPSVEDTLTDESRGSQLITESQERSEIPIPVAFDMENDISATMHSSVRSDILPRSQLARRDHPNITWTTFNGHAIVPVVDNGNDENDNSTSQQQVFAFVCVCIASFFLSN